MKLKRLLKQIKKRYGAEIEAQITERSIVLSGEMENWEDIVNVGYLFVDKKRKRHVVNNIRLIGAPAKKEAEYETDTSLDGQEFDVVIIGGGIVGLTILRELSRYSLRLLLLEKESDVARGASGANDGMIHPGIDLSKKTLKAKYCLAGNFMYEKLAEELDFPFKRVGQYICYGSRKEKVLSNYLLYKAKELKIPGVRRISREEIGKIEPAVKPWAQGAIEIKCTGIVSPYETAIAFAENAIENGAKIALETVCQGFNMSEGKITEVITNRGKIKAKCVINAAGVFADEVAKMADDQYFSIHPRRGTDILFDNKLRLINTIVSRMPHLKDRHSHTKGGGLIRTCDGNILAGPDAEEIPDKYDTGTTLESINRVFEKHSRVLPVLKKSDIIAYFSGIRAATYEEDFIIEISQKVKNLIHVAGIQSPGLTAAPAIALDVAKMALSFFGDVKMKSDFKARRKGIPRVKDLPVSERNALIKENPDYGKIVCRCEEVSLGEIKEAISRPLPARTVDAVKRRVRAGMGRCQGGFCLPHVVEALAEELGVDYLSITKQGRGSEIALMKTKGSDQNDL
ncbi:MAG TPA: NAD(P)/FAD-dependent oxidoreductase [Bacilli bacterium]